LTSSGLMNRFISFSLSIENHFNLAFQGLSVTCECRAKSGMIIDGKSRKYFVKSSRNRHFADFFEKLTNTMDSGKRRKIPVLTVDAVEWGI